MGLISDSTAAAVVDGSYFGNKVASVVIAILPLVFRTDQDSIGERLLLAACGGAGSAIAVIADRPGSWRETAGRIGIGFLTCALFCPWLAQRYGFYGQTDSLMAAAGVMGIISWYLAGSGTRLIRHAQESEWLAKSAPGLIRNWALRALAGNAAAEAIIKNLPETKMVEVTKPPLPAHTTPPLTSEPTKPVG